MKKIIIGFSSPKKFKIGAFGIKLWINKPYSHVYIKFESSNEKIPDLVYHAAHGMVHFREYENFKKENNIISEYSLEVSDESRTKILVHCMKLAGEPYSIPELIQIFFYDISTFLGFKLDTSDLHGYICSELVGKILVDEFNKEFSKPVSLLKPSDIEEKLKN